MASSSRSEEDLVNRLHGLNSSSGCFDESRFVYPSEIKRDYKCPVGWGVLNNPKQVPCCGNAICHFCITKCTAPINEEGYSQHQGQLKCPVCQTIFDSSQLADVTLNFKNALGELHIRCSFEECNNNGPLENLAFHQLHCEWNPEREETCSYCNTKLPHSDLKDHFCNGKVLQKIEDVESKAKEVKLEAEKQKESIEKLLE